MCKPTSPSASKPQQQLRLLASHESFDFGAGKLPNKRSLALTSVLFLAFLVAMEQALRYILNEYKHVHPILDTQVHREILARHIGVDVLCCAIVSICGWWTRHVCAPVLHASLGKEKGSMPAGAHEQRLYTYHPGAFRVGLFFFLYQVKNLVDTIIWDDGPEFIFHHVFSLITSYGALSAGVGHFYAIFFFGLSEVSTGVLCVLANFDDDFGVKGLGDAFPLTKVALGGIFVVLFVVCRCILWPVFSYYFSRDVLAALKINDARTQTRRGWLKFFLVALCGLSVLQIAWLGQIFIQGRDELVKVGLL